MWKSGLHTSYGCLRCHEEWFSPLAVVVADSFKRGRRKNQVATQKGEVREGSPRGVRNIVEAACRKSVATAPTTAQMADLTDGV